MNIKTLIAVATGKIPHNYRSGLCPDELQPDSRDPDCPACKILIEAAAEYDEMERRMREAEGHVHARIDERIMTRDEIINLASQGIEETHSKVSLPIPFVMRFAALVAAAERAEREKQEPVGHIIFQKHRKAPDVRWADNTKIMEGAAIYAAPPVTAQAEGYVTALRYIAWEAAGYMDCVHAAKRAIGETGALPPPPKIQPTEAGG